MTKRLLFFLLLAAPLCAQSPTISIPIVDADFESLSVVGGATITDPVGCGTLQHFTQIPGWTFQTVNFNGAPVTGGVAHWACDDGMPNSNVAFLCCGERMYQLTGERALQGVYVLQFDVANWFYPYPGDWKAELYQGTTNAAGNVILSPAPFCSGSGWALGDMKRQTVTCNMPGYFLQVNSSDPLSVGGQNPGGNIVVLFQSGGDNPTLGGHFGWPILIDNISLTFTPE